MSEGMEPLGEHSAGILTGTDATTASLWSTSFEAAAKGRGRCSFVDACVHIQPFAFFGGLSVAYCK